MSGTQNYTISGTTENWTITTPDGITITPAGDAAGTLNVNITYSDASLLNNVHGILSVDFQPIIDQVASFGFHAPINVTVTNGMSVPIAGFDIMTYNDNMAVPTPVPQPNHPTNYAHFHGPGDTPVPSTIFAPETITTELPDFTPSTADTPSIILASGILAPGDSVTASLEIHNEEIAGDKNGFGFSFFPTGTDTSQAVISGLAPTEQINGTLPFLPFAATSITDSNALPIESATITVRDAANNLTDADALSGAGLTHQSVGTYVLNPALPSNLNSELQALQFQQVGASDTITLSVDNSQGTLVAATASTSVTGGNVLPPVDNYNITDTTTGVASQSAGAPYVGPYTPLIGHNQYVNITTDSLTLSAVTPTSFIKTGSGTDGIDVSNAGGDNVVDADTGSNFLTGGSGNDTFFVGTGSLQETIWDTVAGFHSGDAVTFWGLTPQDFFNVRDDAGAPGATGLTIDTQLQPGGAYASLTLTGYSSADLSNGKISKIYGVDPGTGTPYMLLQGH